MRSVNLFDKKEGVVTRITTSDSGYYCEKGQQKTPFFSLPFVIGDKKYFFEIYFTDNRQNEVNKIDFDLFEHLAFIIEKRFGPIDKNYLKNFDSDIHFKYRFSPRKKEEEKQYGEVLFSNFYERDLLFDLMPFKVKEILLIASLYDAFTIENEGNFTQKILGEYSKLNLTSFPRVTAVSFYYDALEELNRKHFDLIIVMVGNDKKLPLKVVESLKKDFAYIPVYLLLNNNADSSEFISYKFSGLIDNLFIWNGDSRIFFSMTKLLEDKINIDNDAKIGHSRVILLVEDTPRFYSRYLPELYMNIFEQTRKVMEDVTETDDLYKVLSVRVRPKILLASTYEEAIGIFEKYKDNFLSLITDVEFYKNGKKDKNSGIELVKYVKSNLPDIDIPIVIQSRNKKNKEKADKLDCVFIYKDSDTLVHDIKKVVKFNMGFGDFIYRDSHGKSLGLRARNLDDFEYYLQIIPDESLMYHALRNHFSIWLMARGEIRFAEILARLRSEDFEGPSHMRSFLLKTIKRLRYEKTKGKVVEFNENDLPNPSTVVTLSSGAIGGKGRGLVFINKLVYGFGIEERFPNINIATPSTFIIGTDTYDEFIENNNLHDAIFDSDIGYSELKKKFINGVFPDALYEKLEKLIVICNKPLAVRSSGLFEDSLMQPFAGIFETYIIPNNHPDRRVRLQQLLDAIKLVYASVFSPMARDYIGAIDYKVEEEKMAVVIQEVIGNEYSGYFYPHISGTAQSYNYYPFSYLKPEDGLASIALGLGTYVVDGGRAFHFSPKYPKIQNSTLKALVNNSQTYFYAVNLRNKNVDLLQGENAGLIKLDLWDAEKHGTLKHLASVYDPQNNILSPGIDKMGPRVLDFANILKYNYIPLSKTIEEILLIVREAMGSPVEIEFAVDLNKDQEGNAFFYLLQIKPMIANSVDFEIDVDALNFDDLLFFTDNAMGNGVFENLYDVVYVVPEKFNKAHTEEIAIEFEKLNKKFAEKSKKYILISPGRLGTRDKWLGVPVVWSQISNAKVIIETSLPHFPLDASAGSHFFHNVVSMNVGYFSIQHSNSRHFIRWEILEKQKIIYESEFVRCVRFSEPLRVKMDGKKRIAIIEKV
jgi:hypothetical protein